MKKLLATCLAICLVLMAVSSYAACTAAISDQAKQEWIQGLFLPGDTYKIALYTTAAATLNKTTNAYTATGEVSGTGYSAGGANLSGYIVGLYSDTATLDFNNAVWSNATITADCALIYDSTAHHTSCTGAGVPYACCTGSGAGATCDNAAIAVFTFTSTSSTGANWTAAMPTPGAGTSLLRLN